MEIQFGDAISAPESPYGNGSPIYPSAPKARPSVDRWLDWTLSTLQPVDRPVFWALVRTPLEKRDMVAIQKDADAEAVQWRIIDQEVATRRFIEGDQFTIADIALGAYARRWLGDITKPKLPNLERWFAEFPRGRGLCNSSRRRCRERLTVGSRDLVQRDPLETPAPMPLAPPILMQVSEPSIGINPAPYAAHELAGARPFRGLPCPILWRPWPSADRTVRPTQRKPTASRRAARGAVSCRLLSRRGCQGATART